MARLHIEESFDLPAPPDRVFAWLVEPERVVGCLPGAVLEEREDEGTYSGRMTVSLGAVTVVYNGRAVFEEVDHGARSLRMSGDGRERGGSGSARMTMTGRVEPLDGGGSRTSVEAEVEVSGKMVRFGRGMIERVAAEVFRDFAACLAERLTGDEGEAAARPGSEDATPSAEKPAAEGLPRPDEGAGGAGGEERTLRLGPVVIGVLVGWLRDVWDRLRGRGR